MTKDYKQDRNLFGDEVPVGLWNSADPIYTDLCIPQGPFEFPNNNSLLRHLFINLCTYIRPVTYK